MAWTFSSDKPVYIQIADRIVYAIISGQYEPGQQIPTVRQLAMEAAVNPNTVQHAFSELENNGIINSKGTLGRFVTEDKDVIEFCRKTEARKTTDIFLENMKRLSIPKEETITLIEEVY